MERFVKFYQDKISSEVGCLLVYVHAFKELESTKRFKTTSSAKSIKEIKNKYKKSMQRESKRAKSRLVCYCVLSKAFSGSFDELTAQILVGMIKKESKYSGKSQETGGQLFVIH